MKWLWHWIINKVSTFKILDFQVCNRFLHRSSNNLSHKFQMINLVKSLKSLFNVGKATRVVLVLHINFLLVKLVYFLTMGKLYWIINLIQNPSFVSKKNTNIKKVKVILKLLLLNAKRKAILNYRRIQTY